jgi:hypothetical protein
MPPNFSNSATNAYAGHFIPLCYEVEGEYGQPQLTTSGKNSSRNCSVPQLPKMLTGLPQVPQRLTCIKWHSYNVMGFDYHSSTQFNCLPQPVPIPSDTTRLPVTTSHHPQMRHNFLPQPFPTPSDATQLPTTTYPNTLRRDTTSYHNLSTTLRHNSAACHNISQHPRTQVDYIPQTLPSASATPYNDVGFPTLMPALSTPGS